MPASRDLAYLFEAKGLQRYLFASGRLRDAVGASDLLARIASSPPPRPRGGIRDLVEAVARQCGVDDGAFSRRGGGAFCVSFADPAERDRFRSLWRLAFSTALPGLEFSDAFGGVNDDEAKAIDTVYKALTGVRENAAAAVLPLGGPATRFAPRTGRPEVFIESASRKAWNLDDADDRRLDQILLPARRTGKTVAGPTVAGAPATVTLKEYDALAEKVLPPSVLKRSADGAIPLLLPRNLTDSEQDTLHNPLFPFEGERNLAVVHADLSGLGQIFQRRGQGQPIEVRRKLSTEIEDVVLGAVQAAVEKLLACGGAVRRFYKVDLDAPEKWRAHRSKRVERDAASGDPGIATVDVAAFRPLVAGGDDITFLVRSDLAVTFAAALLDAIEEKAAAGPSGQDVADKLPLSACAGIALVKATTPFLMAHDLAEELCKDAKRAAKNLKTEPPYASAITFHSPTGSLGESYEEIVLPDELTAGDVRLTGGPYAVTQPDDATKEKKMPPLAALLDLVAVLRSQKGLGALRQLRTTLFDRSRGEAEKDWRRWRDVQKERGAGLDRLDASLKELGVDTPEKTFLTPERPEGAKPYRRTPLFDALVLLSLDRRDRADEPDAASAPAPAEAAEAGR